MSNLLNDIQNTVEDITGQTNDTTTFRGQGFVVPNVPSGDGTGLPSQKLKDSNYRNGRVVRQLCHWFVPEVGVIPMFINPQSMVQNHTKSIQKERTKGGFMIQYWGEELMTLSINGHTGSSGVEGLNVLYEIYRAEQYMFDPAALQMTADASVSGIGELFDSAIGGIGGVSGALLGGVGAVAGIGNGANQSPLGTNIPSLAAMATGVELYYSGWVFRGYFTSMSITESVEQLGMFRYDINFTVTQRRGYRTNSLPWQRSAFTEPLSSPADFRSFSSTLIR